MKINFMLILLGALILSGCNSQGDNSERVIKRSGEPDVVGFADDDQQMNAAITQAQKSLNVFIKSIDEEAGADVNRTLKVRFDTENGAEHIWVGDVKIAGSGFEGNLENEPVHIRNLKLGDKVAFSRDQITDWLIIAGGKVRGGYTIKVTRNKMPQDEQRTFDEQTGGAFRE